MKLSQVITQDVIRHKNHVFPLRRLPLIKTIKQDKHLFVYQLWDVCYLS